MREHVQSALRWVGLNESFVHSFIRTIDDASRILSAHLFVSAKKSMRRNLLQLCWNRIVTLASNVVATNCVSHIWRTRDQVSRGILGASSRSIPGTEFEFRTRLSSLIIETFGEEERSSDRTELEWAKNSKLLSERLSFIPSLPHFSRSAQSTTQHSVAVMTQLWHFARFISRWRKTSWLRVPLRYVSYINRMGEM
jgi:hypothetical protein